MNRLILASLVFVLIATAGCKQDAPPVETNQEMPTPPLPPTVESTQVSPTPTTASAPERNIIINKFSELPAEIDGCSCYFSRSKAEFKVGEYIYVDNLDDTGFMQIKDEMVQFSLTESAATEEGAILKNGASSGPFSFVLSLKEAEQVDETRQYSGTISVKYDTGEAVFQLIYGECGC